MVSQIDPLLRNLLKSKVPSVGYSEIYDFKNMKIKGSHK
jgi:hypothetical protein